ncbi:hypothetical protein [Sphingomonas sp.]|uniref:hypothetical protein n=1 Tax=Sphingomonas sp. TaxID=28214 RepID=UPI002CEA90C6|nr:hypothetical protein [Sphingomonas sp.]HWK35627.1 hypothetical protein [Sphingomonas sp.]
MIATIPAGTIFPNRPWRTGVAGTIWNGEVGVGGTNRMAWRWAPLRSLVGLGFAADWTVKGADTLLNGRATARPGRTAIDTVSGSADASLLQVLQPTLPFTCDLTIQADFPRIVVGGSDQSVTGQLTTDAGSCRPRTPGSPATTLPPLMLSAEHIGAESRMRLFPATQRRRTLMTIVLGEDGSTEIGMTPEGAAALPFVGLPGGASIKSEM